MEAIESIESMCDGAKDKGNTAIDHDCKIPRTARNMQQDEQMADSDSYSDGVGVIVYLVSHLESSDGLLFKADPFRRESLVLQFYECEMKFRTLQVRINATTLDKVQKFCVRHAEIEDENASRDQKFVRKKLIEFYTKFLKAHRLSALELLNAALDLNIGSLSALMMKGVDWLFTTTHKEEEDVYKLFPVNLKEYDADKFEAMKRYLLNFPFELPPKCDVTPKYMINYKIRADGYWNPELLKKNFHEYKLLPSYEQRRQWLTAHFLLRSGWWQFDCSCPYESPKFKAKLSVMQEEETPSQTMADPNISDMKRKGSPVILVISLLFIPSIQLLLEIMNLSH